MSGGNLFAGLLGMYRTPSAAILAQRELDESRRQLLAAHSASEYYAAMVQVHRTRIARLTATITDLNRNTSNEQHS
jgi:hypothetical protein